MPRVCTKRIEDERCPRYAFRYEVRTEHQLVEICYGQDTAVALFLCHNPGVYCLHLLNGEILHVFMTLLADHAKIVVFMVPPLSRKWQCGFPAGKPSGDSMGTLGPFLSYSVAMIPNVHIRLMDNGVPVLSGDPE